MLRKNAEKFNYKIKYKWEVEKRNKVKNCEIIIY